MKRNSMCAMARRRPNPENAEAVAALSRPAPSALSTRSRPPSGGRRWRWLAAITVGIAGVAGFVACSSLDRTVVAPPHIAGAEYIGDEDCSICHDDITAGFHSASHARLLAQSDNALGSGCEVCHGPGSLHSDAGGGRGNIINPKQDPTICFDCHLDIRGRFLLPSRHPVTDPHRVAQGGMTCTECHSPHKGDAMPGGGGVSALAYNEECLRCHSAQRGPYVFEHEAMREGCNVCHDAHGSVNDKLLVARNASLCLRCHFQQQTGPGVVLIGGQNHADFLGRGTCWTSGCHEAVHGSRVSSSLRY